MPKTQVNTRMSEATREKLDYLTERYGTQTTAVAVAIDRLYQAERPKGEAMTENVAIKVEYSADSLDNGGWLTEQQVADYAESLHDYIAQDYPDAEIEVKQGIHNRVVVHVDADPLDPGNVNAVYTKEAHIGSDVEQLRADHWPGLDRRDDDADRVTPSASSQAPSQAPPSPVGLSHASTARLYRRFTLQLECAIMWRGWIGSGDPVRRQGTYESNN